MPMTDDQLRMLILETAMERATSAGQEDDGSVPAEVQEEIDALTSISADPAKLKAFGQKIEAMQGGDVQLSLGRSETESASNVVDRIINKGKRQGTRISSLVEKRLRAGIQKKSRGTKSFRKSKRS